ncbi:MAG: heavy-metal-associated domain-containing protein [Candidatus Promineifilaceae bacterium]
MIKSTFDLPMMYADHHVTEVRRILANLPGVDSIYASSCFRIVEVTYDEMVLDKEVIVSRLDEAGYGGELAFPVEESGATQTANGRNSFLRHTAVFEQVGELVSFGQNAPYAGRPLWPCPGIGAMAMDE